MKVIRKEFKSAFTKSVLMVDMSGNMSTTFSIKHVSSKSETYNIGLSNKDVIELANYILKIQTDKFLLEK